MRVVDWLMLFVLSLVWGGTYYFVAVAVTELPPLTLVLARCCIAVAILAPPLLLLGFEFPRSRAKWRDYAVMAILNNVIPFTMIFYAQRHIPSGLASVLNATTPLMSLLVLRFVAGEGWTANKLAGVLIGIAGVAILIGPAAVVGTDRASIIAMFLCVAATLSFGFSGLWGRRLTGFAAPVSACSQLTCSMLLLLPLAAGVDRFWTLPMPSSRVVLATVALGVLSTALAYVLFFRILGRAGPLNVMLVTLLVPFTSITLGVLLLGETLLTHQIIGAIVIGISLLVIDGRLFGFSQVPARSG